MLFLLAFIMGTAGFAMLVTGEFTWRGGKKVPARTSRQAGGVLVAFFPAVLLAGVIINQIDPHEESIRAAWVQWPMALVFPVVALFLILRAVGAQVRRRAVAAPARNPFEQPETPESATPPAPSAFELAHGEMFPPPEEPAKGKKPAPKAKGKNPFDFN